MTDKERAAQQHCQNVAHALAVLAASSHSGVSGVDLHLGSHGITALVGAITAAAGKATTS